MKSSTMRRRTSGRLLAAGASLAAASLLLAGCGGGSGFETDTPTTGSDEGGEEVSADGLTSSDSPITVLIGSSGEAETQAVTEAVAAWSEETGQAAEVRPASDLNQQLSQGFAAGSPPDVFYLATEALPGFAANGSVIAYGDMLSNKDDFYDSLVENFTFNDEFYCAPKDFSTLSLIINDKLWEEAGLTEADYPTTWEELTEVSAKLSEGSATGLAFGTEYQRVGVFMAGAGGALVENGEAVADSEENYEALEYVQQNLEAGNFAWAEDLGAGWGGEAFGMQTAAMVVEGNWITGALANDYPDVEYTVVQIPAGPSGPGTLQFTNCWGMAADSPNQQGALDLIEYLTAPEQQLAFAEAFGPMPSVKSAADEWSEANPEMVPFLQGADYAQFIPPIEGIGAIITDFNNQLHSLTSTGPEPILSVTQSNLQAIIQ